MKATMSVDGKKRFDMRITHRVGADKITRILCYKHREDDEDGVEALPDYSRTAILDVVRDQLKMNSDAPNWWTDGIEEEWVDGVWKWAETLIQRRFPELH